VYTRYVADLQLCTMLIATITSTRGAAAVHANHRLIERIRKTRLLWYHFCYQRK